MTKLEHNDLRSFRPNELRTPSTLVPERVNVPINELGSFVEHDQSIAYDEWKIVEDLDLSPDQFRVLGYVINGLSSRRIEQMTGIPAADVREWMRGDSLFQLAVARLKDRREAFLKADTLGLQIRSMEVLAFYLNVDPEERNEDNKPRFNPRVQAVLFQEKRRVATMLVENMLARDRIARVHITHDLTRSISDDTLRQLKEYTEGSAFSVPRIEDVVDGEVEDVQE